jgi:hypothetical protein
LVETIADPADPLTEINVFAAHPGTPGFACVQKVTRGAENVTVNRVYVPSGTETCAASKVESLVTRLNSAMYVVEFSGTLKEVPLEGVSVIPVIVAVKAWMESCALGGGGVAVRTMETVALPFPQLAVQPPFGTPLQEVNKSAVRIRRAAEPE